MASMLDNVRFFGAIAPILRDQLDEQRQILLRELELEDVPVRFNEHDQLQVTAAELEHIKAVFTAPANAARLNEFSSWLSGIPVVVVDASTLSRPAM